MEGVEHRTNQTSLTGLLLRQPTCTRRAASTSSWQYSMVNSTRSMMEIWACRGESGVGERDDSDKPRPIYPLKYMRGGPPPQ